MKHVVSVDSIFGVLLLEATVCGATEKQKDAIGELELLAERDEATYNPYRKAELDVAVVDGLVQVLISETNIAGDVIENGEWARLTIDLIGEVRMTTSHDPECFHVLESAR